MSKSPLYEKTYILAVGIIRIHSRLIKEHKQFVLGRQLLRSGTSIGAQISESEFAQSKSDFIHKLYIAQKETNETRYWHSLLKDTGYISEEAFAEFYEKCTEVLRILAASIKTAKRNLRSPRT